MLIHSLKSQKRTPIHGWTSPPAAVLYEPRNSIEPKSATFLPRGGFELNVLSRSRPLKPFCPAKRKQLPSFAFSWGQSSYFSNYLLQPTGIQPNLHQNSNDAQATSWTWFAANFWKLKNNKHMSGFGKKSNVANACNLSVRPLLCIVSRKLLRRFASNLSFLKKNNTLLALACLTKANQIAKGCQFTNSANLKKNRSETNTKA